MSLVVFGAVARARSLNYDAVVRKRRETGWSYAKLAQFFRVTESAVYYACNPGRRGRRIVSTLGPQRSVYMSDGVWEELRRRALNCGSISQAIDRLVHGEDPPLVRAALSEPGGGVEGSVGEPADGASLAAIGDAGQEVGLTPGSLSAEKPICDMLDEADCEWPNCDCSRMRAAA